MIYDYERLNEEIRTNNIEILEYPFSSINAVSLLIDNKYYIVINSNKEFSKKMKYWIIEHELEHIKNNTMYKIYDKEYIIKLNEVKTDDAVILKNGIVSKVLSMLVDGLDKYEISSYLNVPVNIIDNCIFLINRRRLTNMNNLIDLLCEKKGYNAEILALKLGCTQIEALALINKKTVIKYEQIKRLCEIFDVDAKYLLGM